MKTKLLFIFLVIKISTAICQTSVAGGNVSGTWNLAGSPYLVQGSIQIVNDSTLTIDPGVTVNFQGTYKIYVQGRLLAIGTATDSIIFTSANTTNGWLEYVLQILPLLTIHLNFCIVSLNTAKLQV